MEIQNNIISSSQQDNEGTDKSYKNMLAIIQQKIQDASSRFKFLELTINSYWSIRYSNINASKLNKIIETSITQILERIETLNLITDQDGVEIYGGNIREIYQYLSEQLQLMKEIFADSGDADVSDESFIKISQYIEAIEDSFESLNDDENNTDEEWFEDVIETGDGSNDERRWI